MKLDTTATIALALLAGAAVGGGAVYWLGAQREPASMASMESESTEEREILYWVAPMDPNYRSDEPGKSPMGMDLVPVYADGEPAPDSEGVSVDPRFLQNFAVRTTPVAEGSMPVTIRTLGVLAHNEEKVFSVNTKFEGWIEDARFNNVGERVQQGDVLFAIYSPQLVTTQREYLAAIAYETRLRESNAYDEAVERASSLVGAAEERLRYWDITPEQIDELRASEAASRTVEFASPVSGFIVEKMGDSLEGMKLTPGMTVLKIADHSTLWAEVEFYESDLQYLREGQRVSVEVEAFPNRSWQGRILFFNPAVSPETRTLTGFVEIANADLRLRPQMFATITASLGGSASALMVPEQSVLHSGDRAVVIVAKGDGRFEPREVHLGRTNDGMQEVLHGLASGEEVVTSSQFLIDSESNLRAAITQLLDEPAEEPAMDMPMDMGTPPTQEMDHSMHGMDPSKH